MKPNHHAAGPCEQAAEVSATAGRSPGALGGAGLWAARLACWVCVGFVFLSLHRWAALKELDHDEYERTHAAWLMRHGKAPFRDFFDHKPPYYWWLIQGYFAMAGENDGVFLWGRHMTQAAYALSVLALYLLGRYWYGEAAGLAAAVFFACNKLAHYNGTLMRADAWMVLLLLAGTAVFVRGWNRKFAWSEALLSGALLGLAVGVLQKAVFTVAALALGTAYRCQFVTGWRVVRERWPRLLAFAGVALVPILVPFFLYGWRAYWFFCYVVPMNLEPRFSPYGLFMNLFTGAYGVLPFALFGLGIVGAELAGDHRRTERAALVLLLFAFNFAQVCSNRLPYIQAFHVFMPFLALIGGRAVGWLAERVAPAAAAWGLALLALGGAVVNVHPPYWMYPPNLDRQRGLIERLNRFIPADETCAAPMGGWHPVFRADGTYFPWDFSLKSLQRIDPAFRHDYVAELAETRPFLVHAGMAERMAHDPAQPPRFKEWLAQNYEPLPDSDYWMRKRTVSRGREARLPDGVAALFQRGTK